MVARKSAQAATPQSGTPTTQRTRKLRTQLSDPSLAVPSTASTTATNGHVKEISGSPKRGPAAKAKSKSKSKAPVKAQRQPSLLSRLVKYLTTIILVALTLYTITVCPDDPYLEDPFCRTLTTYNRAIWKPYLEPRLNEILSRPEIAPRVAQIQRISRPYVHDAQVQWKRKVTPRLLHLARYANPYITRADNEYKRHLEPTVRYAKYHFSHYYRVAEPHVHNLAHLVHRYWLLVLPHIQPLLDQKKNVTEWTQKNVVEPLGALKAEYVDSQVEKMLHKVEEVGEGKTRAAGTTATETVASSTRISTTFASAASVPDSVPDTVTEHEPEPEQTAIRAQKPIIPPGPIIPPAPPSPPQEPAAPAESRAPDFDNDDAALDDFLRDLEDVPPTPEATTTQESAPEATEEPLWEESEEERQERINKRAAETAEQRKSIMERMDKWEKKEAAEGEQQLVILKEELDKLRGKALENLNDEEGLLKTEMRKVKAEGSKVIKGTEAYAKKLMGGKSGGAEKVGLFDSVLEKANRKFQEQAKQFHHKVRQWIDQLHDEEQALASKSFDVVDFISAEAQQDLGMDLSYLDDVTVADWTRYHALMKTAQEYGRIYRSFANGTHPASPENPIQPALDVLSAEFESSIADFGRGLADARDAAMATFTGKKKKPTGTGAQKGTVSILPIVGKEDGKGGLQFEDAQAILGRSKEEIKEAAARAEAVDAGTIAEPPVVGGKTTESTPTPAVEEQEEDIDARAAKFAASIQEKFAQAVKEEEEALSKTIAAAQTKQTTEPHVEL